MYNSAYKVDKGIYQDTSQRSHVGQQEAAQGYKQPMIHGRDRTRLRLRELLHPTPQQRTLDLVSERICEGVFFLKQTLLGVSAHVLGRLVI